MPLYEFKCPTCNDKIELIMLYDAPSPLCLPCKDKGEKVKMKKQISIPSFKLNGSGWYKDHYGLKPIPEKDT